MKHFMERITETSIIDTPDLKKDMKIEGMIIQSSMKSINVEKRKSTRAMTKNNGKESPGAAVVAKVRVEVGTEEMIT